jgi:lysyl-tRNA synthetase class II
MLAGRISSIRKHGKTIFIDIREEHKKVQVAMKNTKSEEEL